MSQSRSYDSFFPRPFVISAPPLEQLDVPLLPVLCSCDIATLAWACKLAEEVVMEVVVDNFREFFLTLGPAKDDGPSSNLGGAVTMCLP